jgi:predicted nucleotidyltransferase
MLSLSPGASPRKNLINNENIFIYMKTISLEGSRVKMRILSFFLENPVHELYESEVRKRIGTSLGATNRYLKELAGEGALLLSKKGAMNFYRLNRESAIVKKLKVVHTLSLPSIKALESLGKHLGVKVYIYGSAARGEDVEDSDWDILVIGKVKPDELEREMKPIRHKSTRQIRISLFTNQEWAKMREKDPAFYERVDKDRIELA